jgi:hypothetical protein
MKNLPVKRALLAWLLVGTLDISAAFLQVYIKTGKAPWDVLKYVASGVFGKLAFTGPAIMYVWGLLFHYLLALGFTLLFFVLYMNIRLLQQHRLITGILYGLFMQALMQFVVLPLSYTTPVDFNLQKSLIAAGILIVCIGIPLAFLARRIDEGAVDRH